MNSLSQIKTALVSVYHKDGLQPIIEQLNKDGVKLISTGGTLNFIKSLNIDVTAVDEITGFPEILGGRVKTLHPAVFGGILARRENDSDLNQLQQHNINTIDLVIVDLYPFEETVKSTNDVSEIIEKIDIGGISLIRATAKNYNDTCIISNRNQYAEFYQLLVTQNSSLSKDQRKHYAAQAFMNSSHYDTAIFNYFNQTENIPVFKTSINQSKELRYGENPHQKAKFFGDLNEIFEIKQGKELSYNNLVDAEAALLLINEFEEPTFAIIKHTNACGLASRETIEQAYLDALACDSVSAFGGVLACNRTVDEATANHINNLFFEILIAPDYTPEALNVLANKKNRIIVKLLKNIKPETTFKQLLNGVLMQDYDQSVESKINFNCVTVNQPSDQQITDLEFAIKAVKHLKSNGITIVKNKQLIGMGCGQTSRVDALEFAIKKAKSFGFDTNGAVMSSEAFFPFPDCVDLAKQAGIVAISQPGGSIKDKDSIDAANANNQVMVLTGVRHFKH